MIEAVILDMDGLMFDTERVFALSWDFAGEKTGIGKAGHMVSKTLGASMRASRDVWRHEYGSLFNEDEMRRYSKEFRDEYYRHHKTPIKAGLYAQCDNLSDVIPILEKCREDE